MPENQSKPKKLFHRAHYNIIAAQIRESCSITDLALNLAKRFEQDNPNFDPIRFLDACSPNTDLYPLSELWEEKEKE